MSLNGVKEILLNQAPDSTALPDTGYIYKWVYKVSGSGATAVYSYKWRDSAGNEGYIGTTGGVTQTWEDNDGLISPVDNKAVSIGAPADPKGLFVGDGKPFQDDIVVLGYDGSNYNDLSSNVITKGDSNFAEFPSLTAGSMIYLGCEFGGALWFSGFELNITQVITLGGGSVAKEYYNGTSWVEFSTMATEVLFPHQSYADGVGGTLGGFNVRFNHFLSADWSPTTINSKNLYWVRYRIVSPITQSIRFDYMALHGSFMKYSYTGEQYFGWNRPIRQFNMTYGAFQAALASPSNNDIYLSDNLDVGMIENEFQGGTVDRSGFTRILPLDIDTSTPLKIRFKWIVDGNNSGDVKFIIRWGFSSAGESVYDSAGDSPSTAPNEQSISATAPVPANSNNTEICTDVYLPINDAIAERSSNNADSVWITFQRSGSDGDDTLNENVVMTNVECYYLAWRNGGMSVNY